MTVDRSTGRVCHSRPTPLASGRQRGVAATELALILTLFLLILTGVINLGGVMWVQQKLTEAAAEGARAVLDSSLAGTADLSQACIVAKDSASWLTTMTCSDPPPVTPCTWSARDGSALQCVTVTVGYKTADWPLLSMMENIAKWLPGEGAWVPQNLSATALVQIQGS